MILCTIKKYIVWDSSELPTLDDLIDRKLNNTFKYPRQQTVLEYWERPVRILNSNSDELWDTIQYCFEQFNDALKSNLHPSYRKSSSPSAFIFNFTL